MAAAHVQSTGIQSVGAVASLSHAFVSNVTAGNLIVAFGATNLEVPPATAMTDSRSHTYTRDIVGAAATPGAAIYSTPNITGGACTVTFDVTAGTDHHSIVISEFSGIATAAPIDGTVTNYNLSSTTPSGNVTTGSAGITTGVASHNSGPGTITIGTGYTLGFEDEDTTDVPISGMWQLTAAGTRAVDWTLQFASEWRMCGAGYKESGVAGDTTVFLKERVRPFRFKPGSRDRRF